MLDFLRKFCDRVFRYDDQDRFKFDPIDIEFLIGTLVVFGGLPFLLFGVQPIAFWLLAPAVVLGFMVASLVKSFINASVDSIFEKTGRRAAIAAIAIFGALAGGIIGYGLSNWSMWVIVGSAVGGLLFGVVGIFIDHNQ